MVSLKRPGHPSSVSRLFHASALPRASALRSRSRARARVEGEGDGVAPTRQTARARAAG